MWMAANVLILRLISFERKLDIALILLDVQFSRLFQGIPLSTPVSLKLQFSLLFQGISLSATERRKQLHLYRGQVKGPLVISFKFCLVNFIL